MCSIPAIEIMVCNTRVGGGSNHTGAADSLPRPTSKTSDGATKATQAICLSRFILNTIIFKIKLF
jgi:hypothetical protein